MAKPIIFTGVITSENNKNAAKTGIIKEILCAIAVKTIPDVAMLLPIK
jgi:hypothetical protein